MREKKRTIKERSSKVEKGQGITERRVRQCYTDLAIRSIDAPEHAKTRRGLVQGGGRPHSVVRSVRTPALKPPAKTPNKLTVHSRAGLSETSITAFDWPVFARVLVSDV